MTQSVRAGRFRLNGYNYGRVEQGHTPNLKQDRLGRLPATEGHGEYESKTRQTVYDYTGDWSTKGPRHEHSLIAGPKRFSFILYQMRPRP